MNILTQDAPRPSYIDTLICSGRWSGYVVDPIEVRTIGHGKAERIAREHDEVSASYWAATRGR